MDIKNIVSIKVEGNKYSFRLDPSIYGDKEKEADAVRSAIAIIATKAFKIMLNQNAFPNANVASSLTEETLKEQIQFPPRDGTRVIPKSALSCLADAKNGRGMLTCPISVEYQGMNCFGTNGKKGHGFSFFVPHYKEGKQNGTICVYPAYVPAPPVQELQQ